MRKKSKYEQRLDAIRLKEDRKERSESPLQKIYEFLIQPAFREEVPLDEVWGVGQRYLKVHDVKNRFHMPGVHYAALFKPLPYSTVRRDMKRGDRVVVRDRGEVVDIEVVKKDGEEGPWFVLTRSQYDEIKYHLGVL